MDHFSLVNILSRFFDVRPGELRRVRMMVALIFFLLASNNVIKVVRDSLFLSHFYVSDLSYVYLIVALLAGGIITIYTRYTARIPFYQLMLGSHAFIISNVIVFWVLIVFFNFAWAIYALLHLVGNRRCPCCSSILDISRPDFHSARSETSVWHFQRWRIARSNPGRLCEWMDRQSVCKS